MESPVVHQALVAAEFILGVVTFVALMFVTAPYGRYDRGGWGPKLSSRAGWIVMEAPASLAFFAFFFRGAHRTELAPLLLLAVWQVHYLHRTFWFPFRMRDNGKQMPWAIALTAVVFNTLNAYVNASQIGHFGHYSNAWLRDPRFLLGVGLFAVGFVVNWRADSVLFNLRKPGETGYKIPRGALHDYVANPNYLGEILEWLGWALATWSLAGLSFAWYTTANLLPRALSNLRWYRERFADYPASRKALIPFVL